jgi:FkbM family methyltransferase
MSFYGEIQCGKHVDQTLREYFPDYNYKGVFFDIGAYESINISNSYHFEQNGWDVHCFEANPLLIDGLKKDRKNVYNYAVYDEDKDSVEFNAVLGPWGGGSLMAGVSAIELDPDYLNKFGNQIFQITKFQVSQKTLNTLISTEISHIKNIDIMSIDVEGGELKVLKGLNLEKYKPKLMVIENVFDKNDIKEYLYNANYTLDKHIDYNQYYLLQ